MSQTYPFADFATPQRTNYRRMSAEGQADPVPDPPSGAASAGASTAGRFGRAWTPEQQLRQKQLLIEALRRRDTGVTQP